MGYHWKIIAPIAAAFGLGACATYPYQADFDSCDDEAGRCYSYCEEFAEDAEIFGRCHADCDADANQCFAVAYDSYRSGTAYASYGYGPSTWYGSYGNWYPGRGYIFAFNSYYYNYGYYGRRHGRRHPNRRYDGRYGGGGYGGYSGGGQGDDDTPVQPRRRLDGDGDRAPTIRNPDNSLAPSEREPRPPRRGPDPSVQERQSAPRGAIQPAPPPAQPAPAPRQRATPRKTPRTENERRNREDR